MYGVTGIEYYSNTIQRQFRVKKIFGEKHHLISHKCATILLCFLLYFTINMYTYNGPVILMTVISHPASLETCWLQPVLSQFFV